MHDRARVDEEENLRALDALAERFRPLLELTPIGVFFFSHALELHSANARCAALLNTPQERLRGCDLRALQDGQPTSAMRLALAGESTSYEAPHVGGAGESTPHLSFRFSALREPRTQAIVGGVAFVEDTSDRVRADRALERSEARFRAIIERSRESIAIYRDGRFVFANAAMVATLRFASESQLMGVPMLDVIHPDDRAIVLQRRVSYEQGSPLPPTELRFLRRDGTFGYIEVVSMPIEYDGPAILSIARDMTELRLMQADLLRSDRMASIGTLAAGVAHEINNPLAYMSANLEGIERRKLGDLRSRIAELEEPDGASGARSTRVIRALVDDIEVMVRLAREGTDQVRTIVADLKTFSRSDDAPRSWVDIHRVLDAAAHLAWSGLRRSIALTKRYSETPPFFGNESRLAQVFLNILVNATHAVADREDALIEIIATTDAEGRAVVTIRDNGRGMSPSVMGRIFDPFFTTKPAGEGTGLGLWVCQGIVNAWGGRIDVESAPDHGTSVTVVLPPNTESGDAATPS